MHQFRKNFELSFGVGNLHSHTDPRWALAEGLCRRRVAGEGAVSSLARIPDAQLSTVSPREGMLTIRPNRPVRGFESHLGWLRAAETSQGKHRPSQQYPREAHLEFFH